MSSNVRPESMERITNFELAQKFIDEQIAEVRAQVGDKKVLLALSGGVDSSVVAALLIKAVGKQLVCKLLLGDTGMIADGAEIQPLIVGQAVLLQPCIAKQNVRPLRLPDGSHNVHKILRFLLR